MGWSDILKYASYATPFIPGLQAASPYIIGAATAVDQGLDNKKAAEQATQQLQQGNNQAIGLYQQALGPYVQNGQAASNTLAGLMGLAPLGGGSTGLDSGFAVNQTPAVAERGATRTMPADAQAIGQAQARGTAASLGMSAPASGSSYKRVRMRSPDGAEQMDVPEFAVQKLMAEGAQVVG